MYYMNTLQYRPGVRNPRKKHYCKHAINIMDIVYT